MHCRNWLRISFPLLLVLMFLEYPPSLASDSGYSKYGNFMVDYSSLSGEKLRKEGDEYFVKGYDSPTKAEQEKHYQTAMQKYYMLSQVYPADYYSYVQLARINDERGNDVLAKSYYNQAFNLDKRNPYTNFYFAEYNTKRGRYHKALKYYLTAYNNGYKDNYITNLKLAELYEKLGDISKAKKYYEDSYKIDPGAGNLVDKIESLNALNYEDHEYYWNPSA